MEVVTLVMLATARPERHPQRLTWSTSSWGERWQRKDTPSSVSWRAQEYSMNSVGYETVYIHTCMRTHAHMHTRTRTRTRTHAHAHTHAHTRTRTHTPGCNRSKQPPSERLQPGKRTRAQKHTSHHNKSCACHVTHYTSTCSDSM